LLLTYEIKAADIILTENAAAASSTLTATTQIFKYTVINSLYDLVFKLDAPLVTFTGGAPVFSYKIGAAPSTTLPYETFN
jgi:hypothetical protein